MSIVNPIEVLKQVAEAVPASCRQNIVIVGSLAAAQAFFGDKQQMTVQTKDIDCLIRPNSLAAVKGEEIAQQLLEEKWTRKSGYTGRHTPSHASVSPGDGTRHTRIMVPRAANGTSFQRSA